MDERKLQQKNPVTEAKLPSVHPVVKLHDVDRRGRLLADSRFTINIRGQPFECYKQQPLGKGSFGTVYLAQNTATGKWYAIKFQILNNETVNTLAKREAVFLKTTNQLWGELKHRVRRKDNIVDEYVTVMEMAPGASLRQLSESGQPRPTAQWLEMASKILNSIEQLHTIGIIHRDIKEHNLMLHAASGTVSAIDLGLAISTKEAKEKQPFGGTYGYVAPECYKGAYSTASDVFALGITLARLFGLASPPTGEKKTRKFAICSKQSADENPRIPNPIVREAMRSLVLAMTNPEPTKRPTIAEAQKQIGELLEITLPLIARINMVGLLDFEEYKKASPEQKKDLIKALVIFDEVSFMDAQYNKMTADEKLKRETEYLIIRREIEDAGVMVNDSLYRNSSPVHIATNLPETKSQGAMIHKHFLVSEAKHSHEDERQLTAKGIGTMSIRSGQPSTHYASLLDQHLASTEVTADHKKKVEKTLIDEIARLTKKYQHNEVGQKRIKLLQKVIQSLGKPPPITYAKLNEKLYKAEKEMFAISWLASITRVFGYEKESKSKTTLSNLRATTQQDAEFKRFEQRSNRFESQHGPQEDSFSTQQSSAPRRRH